MSPVTRGNERHAYADDGNSRVTGDSKKVF